MVAFVSYADPRWIAFHADHYRAGGIVERIELPCEYVEDVRFEPYPVPPVVTDTVPLAVEIVRRIAPWCEVIVAPLLLCADSGAEITGTVQVREGRRFYAIGGIYLPNPTPTIALACGLPTRLLTLACHECWHAVERFLPAETSAAIDDYLALPTFAQYHPYWSAPGERRARAFEVWCARIIEGMPSGYPASDPIQSLFADVWSGAFAETIFNANSDIYESNSLDIKS